MADALATIIDLGVTFGGILDVGVQHETAALKQAFPRITHHLFEPVRFYFPDIKYLYRDIPHILHEVALSDQPGTAFLNSYSTFGDGKISHSYLADHPAPPSDTFMGCTEVVKTTLDREMTNADGAPYLLKIDVDGHELQVLLGAQDTLRRTAVVVIEATIPCLQTLMAHLAEQGFRLFDIVDLSYYKATLRQVDLIFIRDHLMRDNPRLDPASFPPPFDVTCWHVAA